MYDDNKWNGNNGYGTVEGSGTGPEESRIESNELQQSEQHTEDNGMQQVNNANKIHDLQEMHSVQSEEQNIENNGVHQEQMNTQDVVQQDESAFSNKEIIVPNVDRGIVNHDDVIHRENMENRMQPQYIPVSSAYDERKSEDAKTTGKKKSKLGQFTKFVAAAALFGVIAGGIMFGVNYSIEHFIEGNDKKVEISSTNVGQSNKDDNDADKSNDNADKSNDSADKSNDSADTKKASLDKTNSANVVVSDVSDVVEEVMPSVVAITSKSIVDSGYWGGLFGQGQPQEQTGAGSGFIIGQNDKSLFIVTNNHVVEGTTSLQVEFFDGTTADAFIQGKSINSDVAVVYVSLESISKDVLSKIKMATVGDSNALKVGEGAIAIGNAMGYGQSVTVGVVSALNRELSVEDQLINLIQTDAAINRGNSGGALLNMKGEVIGINVAKSAYYDVEGMGYSIPISDVVEEIQQICDEQSRMQVDDSKRGYLGIAGRDVTSEESEIYELPLGVVILEVYEEVAAYKAGLEKGNIITEINGKKISSMDALRQELSYYAAGEKLELTVLKRENDYQEQIVTVTLDKQPSRNNNAIPR